MQNKIFYQFIKRLLDNGSINISKVSKSVKESNDFITLQRSKILDIEPKVTGGANIICKDRYALESYFNSKFPGELQSSFTAIDNAKTFRNSKASKRVSQIVILVRGEKTVLLNGIVVDLKVYSNRFGTFACVLEELETEKVCFVENLDSFLLAEQIIDSDFVFIHTYGGLSKSVVNRINASKVLVFPDYDFKGLHNYLLIKSVFPAAELFLPEDYDLLFATKSRTIKTKQGREQQPSQLVLGSTDAMVVKIRDEIFRYKKFLEQQALFK